LESVVRGTGDKRPRKNIKSPKKPQGLYEKAEKRAHTGLEVRSKERPEEGADTGSSKGAKRGMYLIASDFPHKNAPRKRPIGESP